MSVLGGAAFEASYLQLYERGPEHASLERTIARGSQASWIKMAVTWGAGLPAGRQAEDYTTEKPTTREASSWLPINGGCAPLWIF